MKRITFSSAWIALLAGALVGCQTTDQASVGSTASLEIVGHTAADIRKATTDAFLANGYQLVSGLTFEKPGSSWDTTAYGGWSGSPVWFRMRATVTSRTVNSYVLACDGYLVEDRNVHLMEVQRKLPRSKRGMCMEILEQAKAQLDAEQTPAAPTR